MNDQVVRIATRVIAKASRTQPADAVLRQMLKAERGLPRSAGREVSATVFAYYRWRGWLAPARPLADQFMHAWELKERFAQRPGDFPEAELRANCVPAWVTEHLEVSADWLRTLQTEPKLWLRARPGQGRSLGKKLGESWTAGAGPLADAVCYEGGEDLFRTPEFQAGEFEVQDICSQVVGLVCDPPPGETWWDACAGEGGKLLHLSDRMQNKGLIWASDRAEWRLKRLKQRTARARAFNYRAVLWDGGPKLPTKTKFDGALVDAPCSGLGTWQRNPHARWTTTPNDVCELAAVQRDLLARVGTAIKPGGRLVYSVCTLTAEETSKVAGEFEEKFPEFKPCPVINPFKPNETAGSQLRLWPQTTEGNGMFIAAWRRS